MAGPGDADNTKSCSRCGVNKPLGEFPIKNAKTGLRRVWCRDCCRAYGREHYRRNRAPYLERRRAWRREERPRVRAAVADYLRSHPCVDCGETDILLLDFDHRDPAMKVGPVSTLSNRVSMSAVLREIAKCDVRCGNCHRTKTAAQRNWRKAPGFESKRRVLPGPKREPRASSSGMPVIDQLSIWSVGVTRRCSRCRRELPLHEFAFSDKQRGKRQSFCRPCHAAARREHYAKNRADYILWAQRQSERKYREQTALVDQYLREHPCVDCGETNIVLLEFDHVDGEKVMDLSLMLGRRNSRVIREEIAKCDVRCVNCHRRRTAERANWRKLLGEDAVSYNVVSRGCVVVVANDLPKIGARVRLPATRSVRNESATYPRRAPRARRRRVRASRYRSAPRLRDDR